jgi:hypothetical protein
MKNTKRFLLATALLCLPASLAGCAGYPTAVHTHDRNENYVLHVPASSLQVIIPKNGFVQKDTRQFGGSDSPRYFVFIDSARNIIVSGWFESEKAFPGLHQFWEEQTKYHEQKGLPTPIDVTFENIGNWNAVFFDMPVPDYTNSHVRAHWIQGDTWIDLHLSITCKAPAALARSDLAEVLKTVRVVKY